MEPDLSNVVETQMLRTRAPGVPSIEIGIVENRSPALDVRLPPMLLLHGATFGARLFDLPRAGYSLMTALASKQRAVYALDIRGFGTSLGGAAMAEPPSRNPPFAGVDEAIEDIAAAVDVIVRRQPAPGLDLVGFSWGAIAAARYAGDNPEKISRLALYAPLYAQINATWLAGIAGSQDSGHLPETLGAYRLVTLDGVIRRWDADLPTANSSVYREDGLRNSCSRRSRRSIHVPHPGCRPRFAVRTDRSPTSPEFAGGSRSMIPPSPRCRPCWCVAMTTPLPRIPPLFACWVR
jgi:pimeloyl-ACP methyl ester carboxylesterase